MLGMFLILLELPEKSIQNFKNHLFIPFRTIVLDYEISIENLQEKDKIFVGGALGNYSLAGFEMKLVRHVSHYIINYYLPSGLFVVVSWISFLVPADIIPGQLKRNKALFTHRQSEVDFSSKTISLEFFFERTPGAEITQPRQ